MKKLIAFLCLAGGAFGAGTVQQTASKLGNTDNWVIAFQAVGDASNGTFPTTTAQGIAQLQGYLITAVETSPGTPAPSAGYSVTVKDPSGFDVLAGAAASLSATVPEAFAASTAAPPLQGTFTVTITGSSVASAHTSVYVFLSKPNQVGGTSRFSISGATAQAHKWVNSITPAGLATLTQPSWIDLNRSPALLSSEYTFTQTPNVSLTGSVQATVSMAPCPLGVNGADTAHYLYVSGGTGTGEPVLITGGSCVAGATTGTLIFTPANSHSGLWTITSASCGNQEAIWALPAAGGTILSPGGTCVIRAQITKRAIPVYLHGAGEDITIWRVAALGSGDAANFPLTNCAVYCIPDDSAVLGTFTDSGALSDLTISFYQPQTASVLGSLVQWPPAIKATNQNRFAVSRVKWQLAWDGFKSLCCNGVYLTDVKSSAYHHGIDLDQQYDSSRIVGFHSWPFGASGLALSKLFLFDPGVVAFYIGQADDTKIIGCATDAATSADIHDTGTGAPWISFDECEFDTGRINFHSPLGGRMWLSNSLMGAQVDIGFNGVATSFNIDYTGSGELYISNTTLGTGDNAITGPAPISIDFSTTGSLADITLAGVHFDNCRFFLSLRDADMIKVFSTTTYTGTLTVANSKFLTNQSLGTTFSSAMINAVGPVKVIAMGNAINDKIGGTGSWFKADTDSGHAITGNSAVGWAMTYPTSTVASSFVGNTGVSNPIAVSAAVASGALITPSGRFFHITGTAAIQDVNSNFSLHASPNVAIYDFYVIADAAWSTITGGSIANAITAAAGQLIHFVYDTTTSKYSVSQ